MMGPISDDQLGHLTQTQAVVHKTSTHGVTISKCTEMMLRFLIFVDAMQQSTEPGDNKILKDYEGKMDDLAENTWNNMMLVYSESEECYHKVSLLMVQDVKVLIMREGGMLRFLSSSRTCGCTRCI